MTIQYDSKLLYGMELGSLKEVVDKLTSKYSIPEELKELSLMDITGWLNTKIPNGVFIEITYPNYQCDPSEMRAHLNLIEDGNYITKREMGNTIESANYIGYERILRMLEIPYKEPVFYTKYYIYD